jgi:UDPglucose 6-dehydrogenase
VSYVYAAARAIARSLSKFTVVVTKSTVPVGASDEVERIMREENPGAEFAVVSNPEFLREGAAIRDFKHPDRIVIGTSDARARSVITAVSPEEVMRAGFHYCGVGRPKSLAY